MDPGLVTEHVAKTARHTSFYLQSGPADGPLVIFCHGWPELSLSWRHVLPVLGGAGFCCAAPDMRGYGRSSVYTTREAYALENMVQDMLELLDALGRRSAVWVGHDWGAPVVWALAAHHPERCLAVASLCVPYATVERGLEELAKLVNRKLYPAEQFPLGQWEYMGFYEEHFEQAVAQAEANVDNTVKALFRAGTPEAISQPSGTAFVRISGGWFGAKGAAAPDLPRDARVLSEQDLATYASALRRNGFFGPDAWYMNHRANAEYARRSVKGGVLEMPVLFIGAEYDATCAWRDLKAPMEKLCRHLSVATVEAGHWAAQERPREVNAALLAWEVPRHWPGSGAASRSKL